MLGWGLNIVVGPGRPARSRLRRVLCRRRLFLRTARRQRSHQGIHGRDDRPDLLAAVGFLDLPAGRGHSRGILGHHPRISGAAIARRLSRHRDARVRRDHPAGADQLDRPVTNGYAGISGIPRPSFFGIPFNASESGFSAIFGLEFSPLYRTIFLFYLILALALLTNWVTLRLRRLPVGRAWEALREDEIACRSLGINTTNTKLTAFAIGAGFGGFAGAFFAARQNFISPRVVHLHGERNHSGHRRAGRHGQPDRRGDRRGRHDRRHRNPARARLAEARFRRRASIRLNTACSCSGLPWCC